MAQDFVDDFPYSIYMTLRTKLSPMKIVTLFTSQGWSWRNSAWDEYEITANDVAELVVASKDPVLISGGVATGLIAIRKIENILDSNRIEFDFELCDKDDAIIRSRPNSSPYGNAE